MIWEKLGLVYQADQHSNEMWRNNSALTPQPFRLNAETIRVFAGFRDTDGISRIGYVDVAAANPQIVSAISEHPVLNIGRDGCFDDNGLIMGDVVQAGDDVYLFYVGFQLVKKAKFLAFSGVAISRDGGNTFMRLCESPVLGRADGQAFIGAIHTARFENGIWRLWFAQGDGWEMINGVPYPRYHICYTETKDLLNIPRHSKICVQCDYPDYRIGRPKVYRLLDGNYLMYATKGSVLGDYFPVAFRSYDGITWEEDQAPLGITLSESGWDSQTLCYPALLAGERETWMFYNGNQMGVDGFGVARLASTLLGT
ncbi:hypothetical protein ACFPAG_17445 [Vogesella sp. GCM10023246]|uniref:Glycosyl hydrolase family 32 N-terminal domain-containing protein n=1 Tax=Vogesella oryzagri TaxID=3160864 RepID=A0ABV1M848_9NEIS